MTSNIQFYSEKVVVEADSVDQFMATLVGVDLSELNGQVTLDELLAGWDVADVHAWVQEKLSDEN